MGTTTVSNQGTASSSQPPSGASSHSVGSPEPSAPQVNFGDASSIENGIHGNGALASRDAFVAVTSSPTNQSAVNAYVNDLVGETDNEGGNMGLSDRAALNSAATAALHGAGVSDASISTALAQNLTNEAPIAAPNGRYFNKRTPAQARAQLQRMCTTPW